MICHIILCLNKILSYFLVCSLSLILVVVVVVAVVVVGVAAMIRKTWIYSSTLLFLSVLLDILNPSMYPSVWIISSFHHNMEFKTRSWLPIWTLFITSQEQYNQYQMFPLQTWWSSFGQYCNISASFQHLHSKRWTSSQARCSKASASHTTALMEASQHAVTSEKKKKQVWPCKASSVGGNRWCSSCVFSSVSHPCCLPKPALSSQHLLVRICEKAFAKLSGIPIRMSNPVTEKVNKEPEEHEGNRQFTGSRWTGSKPTLEHPRWKAGILLVGKCDSLE